MKKLSLLVLLSALMITSCKKNKEEEPDPTPALVTVSSVPSSFTQKVLIEEGTAVWCGYCPDGAYRMQDIISKNAGKVIGTALHSSDVFTTSPDQYSAMSSEFTCSGIPSGMINRIPSSVDQEVFMNRGYWSSAVSSCLSKQAKCGLAIEGKRLSGNTATITVHAGFKTALTGTINLTIYLLEDNVTGTGSDYDQHNYMNNDPSSPFYQKGDVIKGYQHNHVLRKVLTASMGDAIPTAKLVAGGEYVVTKTVDVSKYKVSDLKVVAFVNSVGSTAATHEVLNVQEASFYTGQVTGKNWD